MASITLTQAGVTATGTTAPPQITLTRGKVEGVSPPAGASITITSAGWVGTRAPATITITKAAVENPGIQGAPPDVVTNWVDVNGQWVKPLHKWSDVGGTWVEPGTVYVPPSPKPQLMFTSARVAATPLTLTPGPGGWNPNIGPMSRPDRGSDPRVGNGQLAVVWYEDLYVTGDTLSAAMARLTTPAVISFPEGRFETADFATGGSLYATVIPKNCLGLWGSGRGSVGGSAGTVFSMVPNSSTKAGNVPAQDNSTPVQMRNLMHIGATGTELSYGQFRVEGTDQGHIYHNFTVYNPPGKVTMKDILSHGHYGNNGAPPGETFAFEVHGNTNNLTNPVISNCEADGRRAIGGPNYGAVGFDIANCVQGSWTNCYAHHTNFASTVCFQAFNITSNNMICGDPSDTDGLGVDGRNAGGWMNHERTSGCVHTNTTLFRVFKNIGKSVHITHSNDIYTQGGFSTANGTIKYINPKFNDIWGDNKLYLQTWHPYWTGCSMNGSGGTGIPAAPFAVNTDGSPLAAYKYVHTFTPVGGVHTTT